METILKISEGGNDTRLFAKIDVAVFKKERHWFAYSPHFKTFGFSTLSEEHAKKDFLNAVDIFFKVHLERNTLQKALSKLGWKLDGDTYMPPKMNNYISRENTKLQPVTIH